MMTKFAPAKVDELTLIQSRDVRLRRDERQRIMVEFADGRRYAEVVVTHAFPVSRPGRCVLLREPGGREIGLIANTDGLDRESQEVLETELDRSYFMPRILHVRAIEEEFGIATWHVVTDRGPTRFQVRARSESIWPLGGARYLIKDVEGNRFDIPSLLELDSRSRAIVELHI